MLEPAPCLEDFGALARTADGFRRPVLLASDPSAPVGRSRYSIAAVEPIATLRAEEPEDDLILETAGAAGARELARFRDFGRATRAALDLLNAETGDLSALPWPEAHAPFSGGLIGYIGYEFGARFERMPARRHEMPALWFGLYPAAYVVDHRRAMAWWSEIEDKIEVKRKKAKGKRDYRENLKAWVERALAHDAQANPVMPIGRRGREDGPLRLRRPQSPSSPQAAAESLDPNRDWRADWEASLGRESYARAVARILDYLKSGDIYQANLTCRYRRAFEGDAAELFARMLRENPAPFSAWIGGEDWDVLSASPELLLDVRRDGWIETRPIKGTAALGGHPVRDRWTDAERRLAASEKERAEHLMIVDLERNDLGRVCRPGSIRVDPLMGLERCPGLAHLVSAVRGRLRPGLDAADALAALFPGGSVTGAPKVRAMEIIHELEPAARGVYCGAVGWIGARGEARFNLPIRTMTRHRGALDLHVGGGIVIDSDPEAEAEECRLKGAALARAVEDEQ